MAVRTLVAIKKVTRYFSYAGIILCMRPANERRRYIVTSSLIGWAHVENDPWLFTLLATFVECFVLCAKIGDSCIAGHVHVRQIDFRAWNPFGGEPTTFPILANIKNDVHMSPLTSNIIGTIGSTHNLWRSNQESSICPLDMVQKQLSDIGKLKKITT